MEQFAYSFAITLMHSIWQMALLLLVYYAIVSLFRSWPALAKRNLLLMALMAQFITSLVSFYFIYSSPFLDYREDIQALLQTFGSSQTWLLQYAPLIFSAWTIGVIYKITLAAWNWKRFNSFYKSSLIKPSVDLRLFAEAKAIHFGIKRKVKIWCSAHITSPVTFGFFKPVILLPVAMVNQLNLQQTESLIVHELTHIRNNDYLFNWFLLASEAMFFFNPFVKIVSQKIKRERERCCDVQVLQFNYPAISYAEALLFIASQQRMKGSGMSMAAVNKKVELLDRIRFFSDARNITSKQTKYFSFVALGIWSFIILNIFFAGIFVTVVKPVAGNTANALFAAGPVNEWNKAFTADGLDPAVVPTYETIYDQNDDLVSENTSEEESALPTSDNDNVEVELPTASEEQPVMETALTLTPVSFTNAQPEIIKEVVINEESSTGVTITQAYRITSTNGEIKMEPLWMISDIKISDSVRQKLKTDSTVFTIIPTVQ
ncbi:MAG: hypothetical protein EOO06_13945 [Chitinophagaceae bacterium]|nr:MAG: hypothetical protein EOO06_13945 [Chitinophagaceae bacterium]